MKPTETRKAELTLGSLARIDEKGNTISYPGYYKLLLDVPTTDITRFTLTTRKKVLDLWPHAIFGELKRELLGERDNRTVVKYVKYKLSMRYIL